MKQLAKMKAGVVKYPPVMYEEAKRKTLTAIFSLALEMCDNLEPAIKDKVTDFLKKHIRFYNIKYDANVIKSIRHSIGKVYYKFSLPPDFSGLPESYFQNINVNKDLDFIIDLSWLVPNTKPYTTKANGQYRSGDNTIIASPKHFIKLPKLSEAADNYIYFKNKQSNYSVDDDIYIKFTKDLANYENNIFVVVHTEVEQLLEIIQHELRHYVQYSLMNSNQSGMKSDYSKNPLSYYTSTVEFGPSIKTAIEDFKSELLMQLTLMRNNDRDEFRKITEANLKSVINYYLSKSDVDEETYNIFSNTNLIRRIAYGEAGARPFQVMKDGKPSAYTKAVNLFMRTAYPEIISAFKSLKHGKKLV